jgi:pimeloyl-ACP methyl ester carboxylesterase
MTNQESAHSRPSMLAVASSSFGNHQAEAPQRNLIFLHANGMSGATWQPVVDCLATLGIGGVAHLVDLPGHAMAPQPTIDGTLWTRTAQEVRNFAGTVSAPFIIGHSLGGSLGLVTASVDHSIAGVYAFEPVVVPPSLSADARTVGGALAAMAQRRRAQFDSREDARTRLFEKPPLNSFASDVVDAWLASALVDDGEGVSLACPPSLESLYFAQTAVQDVFSVLGDVECSVKLGVGADSAHHYPGVAAGELASALPNASMQVIEGVGHFGPLESPKAVGTSIGEWLLSLQNA